MDGMNCTCGNGNPDATRWCPIHHPPIKAHCMGMEFPKRDTDSPHVEWAIPSAAYIPPVTGCTPFATASMRPDNCWRTSLPSAADLDAVAEEQRVKEKTSANRSD